MTGSPRRAMVLCADPGRLLRYGALFNSLGYYHLSLCLDQQELRTSLQSGFRYDYYVHDDFRCTSLDKATLKLLVKNDSVEHFLLVGEVSCRDRRILHEWAVRNRMTIHGIYAPPLHAGILSAIIEQAMRPRSLPV